MGGGGEYVGFGFGLEGLGLRGLYYCRSLGFIVRILNYLNYRFICYCLRLRT